VIQVGDFALDAVIWRYLPSLRFQQLVRFNALWFSKLQNFADVEEGLTPHVTRIELKRQHQEMEKWFPDEERKRQVRQFVESGDDDGRELIVANCWFISDHESQEMWDAFGKDDEGVAVRSNIAALTRSLDLRQPRWWIGKVQYIDPTTYASMNAYEGSQAALRAFLKNAKYNYENELRVAAMNYVVPGCLNPDGSPPTSHQLAGYYYSPDRRGIYVTVDLSVLISEIRTSPKASENYRTKVQQLLRNVGCAAPVLRSELAL
jgi:hypothetical protein